MSRSTSATEWSSSAIKALRFCVQQEKRKKVRQGYEKGERETDTLREATSPGSRLLTRLSDLTHNHARVSKLFSCTHSRSLVLVVPVSATCCHSPPMFRYVHKSTATFQYLQQFCECHADWKDNGVYTIASCF